MVSEKRSIKLAAELAEALRRVRLAFPSSAPAKHRYAFSAIEEAESRLEVFRMGLDPSNPVPPLCAALRSAKSAFMENLQFQESLPASLARKLFAVSTTIRYAELAVDR
jgi:hypothetical protein